VTRKHDWEWSTENPNKAVAMKVLASVDQRKKEIHKKWGKERFMELMDPELRLRFMQMQHKFEEAIKTVNYLSIKTNSEGMLRAYEKCEQSMVQHGHEELTGDIWSVNFEGLNILVVKDEDFYAKAVDICKAEVRTDSVWHLNEILRYVNKDLFTVADKFKKTFPGSKLK